jgi:signal transduction histidine kinase
MKMSRGLASFVEGRAELAEADTEIDAVKHTEATKITGQFESDDSRTIRSNRSVRDSAGSVAKSFVSSERQEEEYSAAIIKTEEALMAPGSHKEMSTTGMRPDLESVSESNSFGGTSISVSSPRGTLDNVGSTPGDDFSEASSIKMLFSRAANLIREAFEVDGGAVFLDAQTGFSSDMARRSSESDQPISFREDLYTDSPCDSLTSDTDLQSAGEHSFDEGDDSVVPPTLAARGDSLGAEGMFSRTTSSSKKAAEILGFSTVEASSLHNDPLPGPASFQPIGEKPLATLLKRYPRGKLWTFDSDGAVSSSEEEASKRLTKELLQRSKDLRRRKLRSTKIKSDARFLSRHFPGVRQLLFVPLWDAGRSRWLSGCFAWSTEPTRVLSKQSELAFLSAFGNSVMAEWSRIDTEIADQKKGDFIGSISHELRSPLHGILASAEFLDEMTDGRSKQLVETIDSCGRTLLDTINHILDYSKINHFEKNWRRTKRGSISQVPSAKDGPLALRHSDLPMLNLFQDVDLSVLCEEVVDSVFAGHVFQNITAQSFDMVSNFQGRMADAKKTANSSEDIMGRPQQQHSGVSVILDVDFQNYHFITQPGALRRLIMNLLGNALKYTSHGYVRIKLDAKEMEDSQSPEMPSSEDTQDIQKRNMVTLYVTDTGKGISPEFLRSKLFMPFAQENSLSSGTGLGLSIVRKIVALLEGEITIDSEVGRGTRKYRKS